MKTKIKKSVSKIICSILLALIVILNGRIFPVAHAAPAAPAADAKPAVENCPAGWNELEKDAFKCQREYVAKDPTSTSDEAPACSELKSSNPQYIYRRLDADSLTPKEAADAATKARITCVKQFKAVPDAAKLAETVHILLGVQAFLNRLIWPILVLTGGLMENDLLFGNGMEEKLRDVWIPIRNLVNILFVVVLVGLALYNVLGLGDDSGNTSIKAMLPKLIIGIIAVNFSFVAIKVFLDGINALTVSIFALPGQVNEGLADVLKADPDSLMVKKLCAQLDGTPFGTFDQTPDDQLKQEQETAVYRQIGQKDAYKTAGITGSDSVQQIKDKIKNKFGADSAMEKQFKADISARQNGRLCNAKGLTPQGKLFLGKYNSRNAAFALALNMGKIVFYEDVTFDVKNAEKLFVNTFFSLLLYAIYAASFFALFVVLLGRLVVMWLCIAVSPVLLLMIATPSLKDKFGDFGKLTDQFIKNAMAPVLISLALTIGWIMLKAVQSLNLSQNATQFLTNATFIMDPSNGVPVGGLYTIQDFMVALGVIAVVWIGVFSAAEGTVAKFATDWMKSHLESAGKWVGALPFKHLPMVPIGLPGHEHKNVTLGAIPTALRRIFGEAESKKDQELYELITGGKKTGDYSELSSIHDKDALLKHVKKAKDNNKLGDEKYIKATKDWLKDNHPLVEEIKAKGTPHEKELIASFERLASGDKDKVRQAIEEIKKNPAVINAPDDNSSKPAAPGEKPKPKPGTSPAGGVSPDQPIGGKPLKEIVKDEAGQRTISEQKTKIDTTLADKTKNDAQKKVDVTDNLTTIKGAFDKAGHKLNANELEDIVGKEKYQEIQKTVGGAAELDKVLQTPPAAAGGAPAPAPSAPPSGGAPTPPPPPAPGP